MPTDTRSSLKRRLPLLLSAVLCVALVGVCFGAYLQLKRQLLRTAGDRAVAASQQIANMLDASAWQIRSEGRQLAQLPEISGVLAKPTAASAQALHDRFFSAAQTQTNSRLRELTLLDRSGRVVAHADSAGGSLGESKLSVPLESQHPDGELAHLGITPLNTNQGQVEFRAVDPLIGKAGDTIGYAVLRARVSDSVGAKRVNGLIGSNAQMLLGDSAGAMWTDTKHVVAGPTTPIDTGAAQQYTDTHGNQYFAARTRMSGAPWSVLVQIPRGLVLQPARSFLDIVATIALLLFLLGAVAAWFLSRQVTNPIQEFSSVAEEFAAGNYARRISSTRADELGDMATAFNSMAAKVETSVHDRERHEQDLENANAELRESEMRYRQLVELSPDGILVHRNGRIEFANAAACRMLGAHTAKDLVGRPVVDLVPPERYEAVNARVQRIQNGQEPLRLIEQNLRRLDGTSISTETIAMRFYSDGQPNVLSILRDVTGKKRLEEQLRQSQKMEAVGQLAGGVAHDFNNLLTIIITYGELLLSLRAGDEELSHDLKEILGAAERAAALTRQLLAFSRRQLLQPKVVDLSALTRDLKNMLSRLLPENIELTTNLASPLGSVSADAGQIEQVVLNLVVNARDAMPNGGRLTIETADVELDADSAVLPAGSTGGPFVMLAVTDSGYGMDEETRLKIFDPFFTTKDPGKGTGLGLSTVYGIVKQSGGSINVYSEPGIGTAFRIYLPRVYEEAAVVAPRRYPVEVSGSETILLVEDDARVREAAERVLRSRGYTVLLAENGERALSVAREHEGKIDLIISDLVMPVMGGRELARHVATVRPNVKILFMSGYTEDAASRSSLLEPGVEFLSKPFTPDSLSAKVRETLRGGLATV